MYPHPTLPPVLTLFFSCSTCLVILFHYLAPLFCLLACYILWSSPSYVALCIVPSQAHTHTHTHTHYMHIHVRYTPTLIERGDSNSNEWFTLYTLAWLLFWFGGLGLLGLRVRGCEGNMITYSLFFEML